MKRVLPILGLLLAACSPSNGAGAAPAAASTADLRVLKVDAPLLLLDVTQLPPAGKYVIPDTSWTGEVDNQSVLAAWGAEEGSKYIGETGRLSGWWVEFRRTVSSAGVPFEVYDSVTVYKTVEGARLSVQKYADHGMQDYMEVQSPPQVGDTTRAFTLKKTDGVEYDLFFSFRNSQHVLELVGSESEVTPAVAISIADALLRKLESVPLTVPGS